MQNHQAEGDQEKDNPLLSELIEILSARLLGFLEDVSLRVSTVG